MKWILVLIIFVLYSCGIISNTNLKPRNIEEYYNTTGVEKYFLSDIPSWANFDSNAGCFKKSIFRYFDINQLMKNYSLDFSKSIQIQASFNEEWLKYKNNSGFKNISAREEELLFYKVSDRVNAKINFFEIPKFKRIHLIWIDEALANPVAEKKLNRLINSNEIDKGVPIFITLCLSRQEAEERFPSFKVLSAEMSSNFNQEGQRQSHFSFELNSIFNSDQEIYLYTQSKKDLSDIFHGQYKTIKY